MKQRWHIPAALLLLFLLLLLLGHSVFVRETMEQALSLCAHCVIPSLFPFLAASSLLLSLGVQELAAPFLAAWFEPLFRVRGEGAAAFLLGLIGGYPIGARTAAELYQHQRLTRAETERLLHFCNNSNPVFLLSVLGTGVFGSLRIGLWLWLIHLAAALLTGLCFRGNGREPYPQSPRPIQAPPPLPDFPSAFVSAVNSALSAILTICAFVSCFYLLSAPLSRLGAVSPWLVGSLELFSLTPLLSPTPLSFLLASTAAGWGGLSVLFQTAALLSGSGLSLRPCLTGKALQALFSGLLALLLIPSLFLSC